MVLSRSMKYQTFLPGLYLFARYFIWPVLRYQYKIKIKNHQIAEDIKPPYILVANHTSYNDVFFVSEGIPHPVSYLADEAVIKKSFFRGILIRLTGAIPLSKGMADPVAIRQLRYLKEHGGVIGIFPEG